MKYVLFGAGDYGMQYLKEEKESVYVVAVIDNNEVLHGRRLYGKYLCQPLQSITSIDYDKIIVAVESQYARQSILEQLVKVGVLTENIEFYPQGKYEDIRIPFIRSFAKFAEENKIIGSVAECGVYTGDSAKYLNRYFPNSKLYLFDTFEGFTEEDVEFERGLGDEEFLGSKFNSIGAFKTSIDKVMSKMPFPENCIVKKGRVPETLKGVNDSFCLVSLDMDLYLPMLAAMRFFSKLLCKNGVMLIHDYNYNKLPGVKKAVNDFVSEKDSERVVMMPLGGNPIVLIKS